MAAAATNSHRPEMRRPRGDRGASAVEFALVLPVMLLVFFAILEYGWYMVNQAVLTGAVSAGVRAGTKANEWDEDNPQDPREEARRAVRESFWPFPIEEQQIAADDHYYLTEDGPRMMNVSVSGLAYQSLTGYLPSSLLPNNLSAKALAAFP